MSRFLVVKAISISALLRGWRVRGWLALGGLGLVLALPRLATAAEDFLPVEQAFRLSAAPAGGAELALRWAIAPGYHLYRERISVRTVPGGQPGGATASETAELPGLRLPAGHKQFDASFGREVETYAGEVEARLPWKAIRAEGAPDGEQTLEVGSQGCADAGLCYPPQTQRLVLRWQGGVLAEVALLLEGQPDGAAGGNSSSGGTGERPGLAALRAAMSGGLDGGPNGGPQGGKPPGFGAEPPPSWRGAGDPAGPGDEIGRVLQAGRWLPVMGVFWLAGLLLSFTPCVLPMVPILSSIIVGQAGGAAVSRGRGFSLALAYALGMALVYTLFGVLAGWLGEGLAGYLQNPWVLGAFGLLLAGLALSMFGLYELQVPAALQGRLSQASNGLPGGRFAGVFAMGGLSALIVGPCVAAPLAGALVYIGQTHDLALGGAALFAMAMGMSVPLLLVGLSAGALLPRAGAWMSAVKHVFGVLLLGVAWWLVSPVLPGAVVLLGWGALLLGCALPLWRAGHLTARVHPVVHTLAPALGLVLGLVGMAELGGALSGGRDPLQPLAHFVRPAAGAERAAAPAEPSFQTIHSLPELEQALAQADRPVMLDFYADWCVACKEMASQTFSEPAVAARMGRFKLLQADVTANSPEERALLKRFGLFGPPGILFFARGGAELADARVIGFTPAERFSAVLDRVLGQVQN